MPLTSDIGSRSFNLGLEVFRARIAANGRGDIIVQEISSARQSLFSVQLH